MNKIIIPVVVAAVVFGAAGFFGGMQFQKSQAQNGFRNFAAGNFSGQAGQAGNLARRNGQNAAQAGLANGDIIAKDDKSITIKLRDGGSKIVFYSEVSQFAKQTSGTADDLAVGTPVVVQGSANSDGSITAQSISIRSAGLIPGPDGAPASDDATPTDQQQ